MKMWVLDLIRKEKSCLLRWLRSTIKIDLLFMKWCRRKKESHASFTATSQTTEVTTIVTFACLGLVMMKRALNLFNEIFWERPHSCNFIRVHCYSHSIFTISIVANLLLCPILSKTLLYLCLYKKKSSVYRFGILFKDSGKLWGVLGGILHR